MNTEAPWYVNAAQARHQYALSVQLGVQLQPGQELVEEAPGRYVIRMQDVMAPPETWVDHTAGATVTSTAPAKPEQPAIQVLAEHADVELLEVRDMGNNIAHIDARVHGYPDVVTAGCGVDQIMDRATPEDREAWCRQVVWDHYMTNVNPQPMRPLRILNLRG